jgi:hypothetical protein
MLYLNGWSFLLGVASANLLGGWSFLLGVASANLLGGWSFYLSVACGVIGVVLGHLARARRAAPGNRSTVLATAGLVLSYGGTLLSLALIALIFLALDVSGPFPPGN